MITPVDKAARNPFFVCKRLYREILNNELSNSGAYVRSNRDPSEVYTEHRNFLRQYNLEKSDPAKSALTDARGYLWGSPKMHKATPTQRFIAGLSDVSTTKCSKMLTRVFTAILDTLRHKDNRTLVLTGVRRFFVVDGYQEVACALQSYVRPPDVDPFLFTGDFSTMYTTIPHDDLIQKLTWSLQEAWNYQSVQKRIDVNALCLSTVPSKKGDFSPAQWVLSTHPGEQKDHKEELRLSLNEIVAISRFLIHNIYLENGGVLYKQVIGLPMGTNCAPVLANIYLYSYESRFINRVERIYDVSKKLGPSVKLFALLMMYSLWTTLA